MIKEQEESKELTVLLGQSCSYPSLEVVQ